MLLFYSSFSIIISSSFLTLLLQLAFLPYFISQKINHTKTKTHFPSGHIEQSCNSRKKCQIKGKQLHLWIVEVIDRVLFQFNIVTQSRGDIHAALVRLADSEDKLLLNFTQEMWQMNYFMVMPLL